MPDKAQVSRHTHRYQYTIPELIGLSKYIYNGFDLSKFSYEAARAGVIPSLSDCAMSSSTSLISGARGANIDGAGSSEHLVYAGMRPVQPERQPLLPPPIERQKDEGFAKFLKKHTSPIHNRVTAGGRIVPMELRSPPPFSLPSNIINRPGERSPDRLLLDSEKENYSVPWTGNPQETQFSTNSVLSFDTAGAHAINSLESLDGGGVIMGPNNDEYGSPQGTLTNVFATSQVPLMQGAAPMPMTIPVQATGGTFIQSPAYGAPYNLVGFPWDPLSCFGMTGTISDVYTGHYASPASLYNQPGRMLHTSQVMSPHQLLEAWEQHYSELDQQLQNIDRHRAMSSLDPQLAEQRRVIVQQRSDAKDFIREHQRILGIGRHFDSSQESWNTSFNVEAPVYVPRDCHNPNPYLANRSLHKVGHGVYSKPKNSQRHAIPIKLPPADPKMHINAQDSGDLEVSGRGQSNFKQWAAPSKTSASRSCAKDKIACRDPTSGGNSSTGGLLKLNDDSEPGSLPRVPAIDQGRKLSGSHDPSQAPTTVSEEQASLIDAISRPKGTISKVRLLDHRVVNVEGQGLGPVPVLQAEDELRVLNQLSVLDIPTSKENVFVNPTGRRKAATDMFLTQINGVGENTVLVTGPETQSLRSCSNGSRFDIKSRAVDDCREAPLSIISNENLVQLTQKPNSDVRTELGRCAADGQDFDGYETEFATTRDMMNIKGYSIASVQNIHAVGSLPNSLDGAVEVRNNFQAHLNAASNSRSPRLLRRLGGNGGAWYGPYCRDVAERA